MKTNPTFSAAVGRAKSLPRRPDNETLLQLYALYKQATFGDAPDDRPAAFDFKAVAKYNAWVDLRGISPAEAQQQYVALVDRLEAERN